MRRCNWILWLAGVVCAAGTAGARAESAREILDKSGVQGGLIVHLDCGDGRLTTALQASDRIMVHGFDRDRDQVEPLFDRLSLFLQQLESSNLIRYSNLDEVEREEPSYPPPAV